MRTANTRPQSTSIGRAATIADVSREQIITALRRYFESRPAGIVAAYLFGSVARGQQRPDSDVDVGVLFAAGRPKSLEDLDRLAQLQDELAALLHRRVDLVAMNGAPPDLLHRILVDRVLVHDADPERRIEFEMQTRSRYFDLAPYLQRYRQTVLKRL